MTERAFQCRVCGSSFSVPEATLTRFPGWEPRTCRACRDRASGGKPARAPGRPRPAGGRIVSLGDSLTTAAVLERYTAGPKTGLFTDGSASPNPGPGGWGVVYVVDDEIIDQAHGHEAHTTNNRMELTALIRAFGLASQSVPLDVFTDSELCVRTINEWAPSWERRGWKRKDGPIKNLELVQELYALARARPNVRLRWIKAHDGSRWNEYADALASAWARPTL